MMRRLRRSGFQRDGHIDLAAYGFGGALHLRGEGNGSFNATAYPVPGSAIMEMRRNCSWETTTATGKPTSPRLPGETGGPQHAINVFYGNNDFTFTQTTPYTSSAGIIMVGSGDLNSDGITDLYAITNYSSRATGRAFTDQIEDILAPTGWTLPAGTAWRGFCRSAI